MKKSTYLRITDPFGDYDGDGVPNWRDCEPCNPKKHGVPLIISPWSVNQLVKASQKKNPTKRKAALIKMFNEMEAENTRMYDIPFALVRHYRKKKAAKVFNRRTVNNNL
jgi:hypothetical protein